MYNKTYWVYLSLVGLKERSCKSYVKINVLEIRLKIVTRKRVKLYYVY